MKRAENTVKEFHPIRNQKLQISKNRSKEFLSGIFDIS